NNIKERAILIGIGAGSIDKRRQWPAERFSSVIRGLLEDDNSIVAVLFGDNAESAISAHIRESLGKELAGRLIDTSGKTALRQTAALLKHCRLYIGNDTGIMHIAAAMKAPVVEISRWPKTDLPITNASPHFFAPWRVKHKILNPDRPTPPCKEGCQSLAAHCILGVKVEDVEEAAREILSVGKGQQDGR
ncbi:MAG: glycosyltransferase family 9 protein, partial [Candidatus Omnitrophica bacterium]|nr:glycosyltransferase family 9 protein [Candidatus Omnitrophota bacterium]